MSLLHILSKNSLALALAAGLLAGCKGDEPTASGSGTTVDPNNPAQYGTPFTGVPDRQDASVYQVNMRAFSARGNFAGVTARLDSIKALGVNVLYLMPIYPVGQLRGFNSPYAVQDYREVNPEFGNLNDLRTLVDAAHARGLSVMLDWVANHTSWDHAWITKHPDWYKKDAAGAIIAPPGTTYTDVAQLDFSNTAMRAEMVSAMKSWVYSANIDGFRFDYADFQPADFWQQVNTELRAIRTHKLLLLAEGTRPVNFTAGFDYNFGFSFYEVLKQVYINGNAATRFDNLNATEYEGASTTQQVVRYVTNHDVNGSDNTPANLFTQNGALSGFAIAALYKGVPMVYNGQEAGMTTRIPFPFTSVKVSWDARPDITRAHKQILKARASSRALRSGTIVPYSTADVCAFTKTEGNEQALVLVNVRRTATTYQLPAALNNTTWTDALQGGSLTLNGQVELPAYGYLVLKK